MNGYDASNYHCWQTKRYTLSRLTLSNTIGAMVIPTWPITWALF